MICSGIDFAFAARADDIARAIPLVTKKGAPTLDTLFLARLGRIKGRIRSLRISR